MRTLGITVCSIVGAGAGYYAGFIHGERQGGDYNFAPLIDGLIGAVVGAVAGTIVGAHLLTR